MHWQEDSFFFFPDKARYFNWEGVPRQRARGKGTQEDCSALRLAGSRFMVMRLVSIALTQGPS